jgi:hypothetical protein
LFFTSRLFSNQLFGSSASLQSAEQQQQQPTQEGEPAKRSGEKSQESADGNRNERVKIKIRRSVKIPRSQLYHILLTDDQWKMIPKDIPNKFQFFGIIVSGGKNKSSWNVKWDVLPKSNNIIYNIMRSKLTVVADGEGENALPDDAQLDDIAIADDECESPTKEKEPSSDDVICALEKSVIRQATTFFYKWGWSELESVTWKIMEDLDFVTYDGPIYPDKVEMKFDEKK